MKTKKDEVFAVLTTTTFERTPSGKSWSKKPVSVETREIAREAYDNMTSDEACRFFRRLGGSERVERSYTSQGYLPIQITSTSPDRTVRKVRVFKID